MACRGSWGMDLDETRAVISVRRSTFFGVRRVVVVGMETRGGGVFLDRIYVSGAETSVQNCRGTLFTPYTDDGR
jgi:hypothetical protein